MEDEASRQTKDEARVEGNLRSAVFKYGIQADLAEEIFETAGTLPGIDDETLKEIEALERQFEDNRGLEKEFFDWEGEQGYNSDALYRTIREAGDQEDVMELARQIDRDAGQLGNINHAALEKLQKANIDTGDVLSEETVTEAVEDAFPDDYATQDDIEKLERQMPGTDISIDYDRIVSEVVDDLPDDYVSEQEIQGLRDDVGRGITAVRNDVADVRDDVSEVEKKVDDIESGGYSRREVAGGVLLAAGAGGLLGGYLGGFFGGGIGGLLGSRQEGKEQAPGPVTVGEDEFRDVYDSLSREHRVELLEDDKSRDLLLDGDRGNGEIVKARLDYNPGEAESEVMYWIASSDGSIRKGSYTGVEDDAAKALYEEVK